MNTDREYHVVVHPNLRARMEFSTDYSALSLSVDYRRDGEWEAGGDGFEIRGQKITINRDGDSLLERDVSLELLERYGTSITEFAQKFTDRGATGATESAETAEPESWPIAVTQDDGSVVEALRPPTQATFEVYEDRAGEWRWRLTHQNGNIIADCGEGYSSKRAAKNGIESVKRNALGAPTEES